MRLDDAVIARTCIGFGAFSLGVTMFAGIVVPASSIFFTGLAGLGVATIVLFLHKLAVDVRDMNTESGDELARIRRDIAVLRAELLRVQREHTRSGGPRSRGLSSIDGGTPPSGWQKEN